MLKHFQFSSLMALIKLKSAYRTFAVTLIMGATVSLSSEQRRNSRHLSSKDIINASSSRALLVKDILSRPAIPLDPPTVDPDAEVRSTFMDRDGFFSHSINSEDNTQINIYHFSEMMHPDANFSQEPSLDAMQVSHIDLEEDKSRAMFESVWSDCGLSCAMEPQDLAMAVTRLKVDLYEYDNQASIGILASQIVNTCKDRDYLNEYRSWTRKYTGKLCTTERELQREERRTRRIIPLEEKKRIMRDKLSKCKSRTYGDWKRNGNAPDMREVEGIFRARQAGSDLLTIACSEFNDNGIKLEDLSIAQLEECSRHMMTGNEKEDNRIIESIKKYLMQYLNKIDKQLIEFKMLRLARKERGYCEKAKSSRKYLQQAGN